MELRRMRMDTQQQIQKLELATESLQESMILQSIRDCTVSNADVTEYSSAITVLVDELRCQLDLLDQEILTREQEKISKLFEQQASRAEVLESDLNKGMHKHLKTAKQNQLEAQQLVVATNEKHASRVRAIQRKVQEEREHALNELKRRDAELKKKEDARAERDAALANERRRLAEEKERKLNLKMEAFDKARMKALEVAPRVSGDTVKDLTDRVQRPIQRSSPSIPPEASTSIQKKLPLFHESESMERLLKLPTRGTSLSQALDSAMTSKLDAARKNKLFVAHYTHDKLADREKRHEKNLSEIERQRSEQLKKQHQADREREKRIADIRVSQSGYLESLRQTNQQSRNDAMERANLSTRNVLSSQVDPWAARARHLIESACKAIVVTSEQEM